MLLSILIPTLASRQDTFWRLHQKLQTQMQINGLEHMVEILTLRDHGVLSIGAKRNTLLKRAQGTFVVFVDDDDDVCETYVQQITTALQASPEVDCIGLKAQVTFRGSHPHTLVYSVRYDSFRKEHGIYLRPPQHITPIRREIAVRYKFADTSYGEDFDWALRLCQDRALHTEHFLDAILYYYFSRRRWAYQWLLDCTESVRHPLGLQQVNRVRFRRWVASRFLAKGVPKQP